jgi:hypothetical protein
MERREQNGWERYRGRHAGLSFMDDEDDTKGEEGKDD